MVQPEENILDSKLLSRYAQKILAGKHMSLKLPERQKGYGLMLAFILSGPNFKVLIITNSDYKLSRQKEI